MRAAHLNKPRPYMLKADAKSRTIHTWLHKWHPLAGTCEQCGKQGRTEFAYQHHPAPYTRNRADYREMCRSCHLRFDRPNGLPAEARARMAASKRGSRHSEETKRKMSLTRTGMKHPPRSEAALANIRAAAQRREAHKRLMS